MSLPTPPPVPPAPRLPWGDPSSPLPPPPPPPRLPGVVRPPLRPGQLTPGWRHLLTVGWVAILLSLAAVWKSAWTLGFPTWWLGPQADPRFPLLLVLPFVLPLLTVIGAMRNVRNVVVLGIVAALVQAAIAWGDVGRQDRIALVEFAIAAGGLAVSVAAFAGRLTTAGTTGTTGLRGPVGTTSTTVFGGPATSHPVGGPPVGGEPVVGGFGPPPPPLPPR